jgi:hypothetical protein
MLNQQHICANIYNESIDVEKCKDRTMEHKKYFLFFFFFLLAVAVFIYTYTTLLYFSSFPPVVASKKERKKKKNGSLSGKDETQKKLYCLDVESTQ